MLQYLAENESKEGSHFFITTKMESLYGLFLETIDIETLDFNDEFLQDNVVEMMIVRLSEPREIFCKSLASTIKSIFDKQLYKYDNHIIYISVGNDKWKKKLIDTYILNDNNDEFHYFNYSVNGYSMYFFFNDRKTSSVNALSRISQFFKDEYGAVFEIQF